MRLLLHLMVKHWKLYGVTHFLAVKLTGRDFEMQAMKLSMHVVCPCILCMAVNKDLLSFVFKQQMSNNALYTAIKQ